MATVVNSYAMTLPAGFSMVEGSQEIIFERKWFTIAHLGTLLFALLWNAFSYFFYLMMISGNVSVIILLFPVMHMIVGIWLLYFGICGFFNKTIITANRQDLSVRHLPLPWSSEKVIPVSAISQLYITEHSRKHRGSVINSYNVEVMLTNSHAVLLVKGLDSPEEATFIEKAVERFLRIEDHSVEGEYIIQ